MKSFVLSLAFYIYCTAGVLPKESKGSFTPADLIPSSEDPTLSSETLDKNAAPWISSQDQCSLGTNSSLLPSVQYLALLGKLYVDFEAAATCTGIIARWEVCFVSNETPNPNNAIDVVVLRHSKSGNGGYIIVNIHELILPSLASTRALQCDYVNDYDSGIVMKEGDVIGFVSRHNIQVALTVLPEGTNSTLKFYDLMRGRQVPTRLLVNNSIQQDSFQAILPHRKASLIRVILSE